MKAQIKKQPELSGYLELNKKYGYGYQGRLVMGNFLNSVIDTEPFTLDEAYSGMVMAIQEINRQEGYNYDPYKIIGITDEALQVNKLKDVSSATIALDIEKGRGEYAVPLANDCRTEIIDGEEEVFFTGRGTVLLTFFAWRDDKLQTAKDVLMRYCQYLAMNRYGGAASEIFDGLEKKDKDGGADWIKASYTRFVKNDVELLTYIMPNLKKWR